MSSYTISGASKVRGEVALSGDKSLSHRLALIASLAEGRSQIENFSSSADCQHTLDCLRGLACRIEQDSSQIAIQGQGLFGLQPPRMSLDAGNSGSTIRMLTGILAGQSFSSMVDGDSSLRRRPMKRIVEPLRSMGADVKAEQDQFPPLRITGRPLEGIRYQMPIASAQTKSCILLAGLLAGGQTTVEETLPTRDHTELMLPLFGARIERHDRTTTVYGRHRLQPISYRIPGDVSSAAFLVAAALLASEADLVLPDLLLNPTRTGFLDFLRDVGAPIRTKVTNERGGEMVGEVTVEHRGWTDRIPNRVWQIGNSLVPKLVDEIPLLAVLATLSPSGLQVKDALELRVKESDRISATVQNLRILGVEAEETKDGMIVQPASMLRGGLVDSCGDHRIAMAMAVCALRANEPVIIEDSDAVAVSFPDFFQVLRELMS